MNPSNLKSVVTWWVLCWAIEYIFDKISENTMIRAEYEIMGNNSKIKILFNILRRWKLFSSLFSSEEKSKLIWYQQTFEGSYYCHFLFSKCKLENYIKFSIWSSLHPSRCLLFQSQQWKPGMSTRNFWELSGKK